MIFFNYTSCNNKISLTDTLKCSHMGKHSSYMQHKQFSLKFWNFLDGPQKSACTWILHQFFVPFHENAEGLREKKEETKLDDTVSFCLNQFSDKIYSFPFKKTSDR